MFIVEFGVTLFCGRSNKVFILGAVKCDALLWNGVKECLCQD